MKQKVFFMIGASFAVGLAVTGNILLKSLLKEYAAILGRDY